MSQNTAQPGARRAAVSDSSIDPTEIRIETLQHSGQARRSHAARFGRGAVASMLAATMAVVTMFGYVLTNREAAEEAEADLVNVEIAVPAAAVQAAELGFADRTESASRSAVRSNLAEAVASEGVADREALIDSSVTAANDSVASMTAEERDTLMAQDMELVKAQEDKLKKEAEEARKRLEEAKRLAELQAQQEAELQAQREAARASADSTDDDADSSAGNGSGNTAELDSVSDEDVAAASNSGGAMPLQGNYRTGAGFGATGSWSRYHTGQDFSAAHGTPIYAVASGIVLSPTAGGWAGVNVVIQHGNGGSTLYAHMSRRTVSPGQAVQAGQLIGYVGNTGRSFGPHLHLEYYQAGVTPGDVYRASNPMSFLRSLGVG